MVFNVKFLIIFLMFEGIVIKIIGMFFIFGFFFNF